MRFPLIFIKELVYEKDIASHESIGAYPPNVFSDDITLETLEKYNIPSDIYDYCTFRVKRGFKGVFAISKATNEVMGYSFYSTDKTPPTNIPKKPPYNSVWIFNDFVIEKFRGMGLQKFMIDKRLEKNNNLDIAYTDILESNIASRKSYLNSGFEESGVYYIMVLGIRRYKYLNIKMGYWNKNKKHPAINK